MSTDARIVLTVPFVPVSISVTPVAVQGVGWSVSLVATCIRISARLVSRS